MAAHPASGASRRLHLAMLVNASQIASRERIFLGTARRLAQLGWRVSILAACPSDELKAAVEAPVELVDVGRFDGWRFPAFLPHLVRLYLSVPAVISFLKRTRPDVLFGTSIPPNIVALMARRLSRQPARVVIRQSNVIPLRTRAAYADVARRPRDWLMPMLYPAAHTVIAVSDGVADNLRSMSWIDPARVRAVANAVELGEVSRKAAEPVDHPWLAQPGGGPVLIAVGRLIRKKDYPTLLHAFRAVADRTPARLLVLGEGPERPALTRLAGELGLSDRVDFAGHKRNPFAYMALASLFVMSSRFEGMPSVVIEALACGCPVVSTDCPSGPSEILGEGAYGTLVPVGDAPALADAILQSLASPPDRARLIARAAEFSLDRAVERYAEILTSAAKQ